MRRPRWYAARVVRVSLGLLLVASLVPTAGFAKQSSTPEVTPSRYEAAAKERGTGLPGTLHTLEPKRVIVRWARGVPEAQVRAAGRHIGFKVVRPTNKLGYALIEPTDPGLTPVKLASEVERLRLATRAEVEKVYAPTVMPMRPNDPYFETQWALENTGQTGGTPGADIGALAAWAAHGTGSKDVVVAVVDTGVDIAHEDLKDNIWRNAGEIPGNGRDDDRNGYIDDIHGYDFYNHDATVYDQMDGDQHGTHVAGIIGAVGDNEKGIAGVNHAVTIMPVKFLGPWGGGEYEGAEALLYAVDNGAQVINCSWGGGYSSVIEEALNYAASKGVIVVAAAGNDSANVDDFPEYFYPASSDATSVITVAATDHDDELSWFSNYGEQTVELAAPGEEVTSTLPYDAVGVYVNAVPYKVAFLAFAPEAIEPASAGRQAITGSLTRMGVPTTAPIVIVDDSLPSRHGEVPGERLTFYTDALAAAGYTNVSTWSVEDRGTPSRSTLQGKVVVWFTGAASSGWGDQEALSEAERTVIAAYLDNGGRLLLASGEAASDTWDYEWFMQYLHVYPIDFTTWGSELRGAAGTPFAGITGALKPEYTVWWEWPWPTGSDVIAPADDSAQVIFEMGGYGPLSGTSMAAPHVTGAAAHILAASPGMDPAEVKARIENTAERLPSLDNKVNSGGRLDLERAFTVYPGKPQITYPTTGTVLRAGTDSRVDWSAAPGGSIEATVEVEIGLPYEAWTEDFEDGVLDDWDFPEGSWDVTSTAHGGSFGMGVTFDAEGWASAVTTISVPEGGGTLSLWGMTSCPEGSCWAEVYVDGAGYALTLEGTSGWTKGELTVPSGEYPVWVNFYASPAPGQECSFVIDDLVLQAHAYAPLGAAPVTDGTLPFTVPDVSVPEARFRARATLEEVASGWSYVKGVRISSDFVAPGAPSALEATPGGDGDVHVMWTDPDDPDFAYTRVLRSLDATPDGPDDPAVTVVYEGTDGAYHDVGLPDGAVAYYAAYAVDGDGNWSEGAFAQALVSDTLPPSPVAFLEASMREGAVVLSWMNPPAWQFTGIMVLRRTDATPTAVDDPQAAVIYNGSDAHATDYDIMTKPDGTTAYYAVFALDASGNVSEPAATRITIDTKSPLGSVCISGSELKRSAVSGEEMYFTTSREVTLVADVTGATEMRFDKGEGWGDWEPFSRERAFMLEALDGPTVIKCAFRDEAGNTFEPWVTVYHDIRPPEAPTGLIALNWNYSVRLIWDAGDDESVVGWNVYQAMSESGPWTKLTGEMLAEEPAYTVSGLEAGQTYHFKVTAIDGVGREGPASSAITGTPAEGVVRVFGPDRYATAAELSRESFPSADTVILATGLGYADALGASGLAGVLGAPILLTEPTRLTPGVAEEIIRLGASKVIVVGGTAVVSPAVVSQLPSGLTVERIGGRNRFETAALVAERMKALLGDEWAGEAFVANGYGFADALAVGPLAYAAERPILLVRSTYAPDETIAAVDALELDSVIVLGGEGAVGEQVLFELGFPEALRLSGMNRFETAVAIAEYGVEQGWSSFARVGVTSGRNYPDALAGGPAIGKKGGVILLTEPARLSSETADALSWHAEHIERVDVLGGPGAVSDSVVLAIIDILSSPGF